MKLTIESTHQTVTVNGVPARVWVGKTESGIEVHCLITRVAVHKDADTSQFERELREHAPPLSLHVFPLRMVL